MPDLYRLRVGPLNAAYYQQQFSRFETLGKAVPSWNHGAAFFTLAWLVLRKLWRPAGIYAAVLLALVLLWAFGLHARVPMPVEAAICLFTLLLLCAVPGFLANGWYYQQVRSQTLSTLTAASSIGQARAKLGQGVASKERLYMVAAVQAVVGAALAALLYSQWGHASADAPPIAPQSGPPDLVIPEVSSLYQPASEAPLMEPALPEAVLTPVGAPALDHAATPEPSVPEVPEAPAVMSPANDALTAPQAPASKKTASKQAAPHNAPAVTAKTSSTKPASTKTKAVAEPAPAAAPGRLIPGKYYLNAGVYAEAANVNRSVKQLQALKLPTLRQTVSSSKGDLTRLRIGPFDTRKQAEQAAAKAKKLRIDATVFQQPKS